MSDRRNDQNPDRDAVGDRDTIARLLQLAGPRPRAPLHARERVRQATRQQWLDDVTRRRRRRFAWRGAGLLAAAAALALALGLAPRIDWLETTAPPLEVATLSALNGGGVTYDGSGVARLVRPGDAISTRGRLETGASARAALDLAGGGSLRLDRSTRLRFVAADVVALEHGAIYFDSGGEADGATKLTVETTLGRIQDIGTQFEVRSSEGLRVRVREGKVNLDRQGTVYEAVAGVELWLSSRGELSRGRVAPFGPEWDWVLEVAQPFRLDGQPLDSFLAWVSRETGRAIHFADAALAETAPGVRLHGSIAGLRPDEALAAVLPTCGLTHQLTAGTLLIEAETR